MKIFYSWQSDIQGNMRYLQDCLMEAIREIPNCEIETATRNAKGAVDISQTLLAKISQSDMFVADVSIINPEGPGRKTPNPNVVYELGYAVGKKGEASVVLVANSETTDLAALPFDIRNRRIIARKFTPKNLHALANELAEIIASHNPEPEDVTGPYIYLELAHYGSAGIGFSVHNDDSETYKLESIELGGVEDEILRSLPAKEVTTNVHSSKLPRPPFGSKIQEITFIVSRLSRSYRIHQRLILSGRADEKFNLERLDPEPSLIEHVPKRRAKPIFGDVQSLNSNRYDVEVEDTDTHQKFTVGVTGTVAGIWTTRVVEMGPILERLGRAINERYKGEANGEFLIQSYDDCATPEDALNKIISGELFVDKK